MIGTESTAVALLEPVVPSKRRRRWPTKFRDALRGLKLGIRGHSSFFVHFFTAALVLAAGLVFQCVLLEWCILLGCIGMVLTAELFNSAIETLFRGLDAETKERTWPALDISAGAVLLASLAASASSAPYDLPAQAGPLARTQARRKPPALAFATSTHGLLPMASVDSAVLDWLKHNHDRLFSDLAALVKVPSISTDGDHQPQIEHTAAATCEQMRAGRAT